MITFLKLKQAIYEADYEQDNLCIAQTLSLLSLWWESPTGHKSCWYWSGLAINLLHLVFLDIKKEEMKLGKKVLGKWKRLWWSCFVRDRIIGIGMKLPMRLHVIDYGMEPLDLDDFDIDDAVVYQSSPETTTGLTWNPERLRKLYILYMEEVKLCLCMDYFHSVQR